MDEKELQFDRKKHILYSEHAKSVAQKYLKQEYGEEKAEELWEKIQLKYIEYLKDSPDVGGKKNSHAKLIYDSKLLFAYCQVAANDKTVEELQDFSYEFFMAEEFAKLGKIFNLNNRFHLWLANIVFGFSGKKDRKQQLKFPESFHAVVEPFDKEHRAVRYQFTKCPNADFAKSHGLERWMPLLCNCDYMGLREIGAELIRCGTCMHGDCCDYCIVASNNPITKEHPLVIDENGYWVNKSSSDT